MADLHVFLGRKLTSAVNIPPYGLTGMSTDMVHYGSVPEAILMEEMESLQRILSRQISGGHAGDASVHAGVVCAGNLHAGGQSGGEQDSQDRTPVCGHQRARGGLG